MHMSSTKKRPPAILAIIALSLSGVFGLGAPAIATTPFEVVYNGNTIGTQVPANQTATRGEAFTLPAGSAVTGSRTGYTFGGWSLTPGGVAVANPFTYTGSATSDNNRLNLHAVWNTTLNYNLNGADSGTLPQAKVSDTYRFGQSLTLPTSGTAVKAGFAFGGWLASPSSTNRLTTYTAGPTEAGNQILYAAWIKTVSFNPNGAATGTIPTALTYFAGGDRLKLPVASEMTLRRTGYDFVGWSTSPTGTLVSNPNSYLPIVSQRTLFAIWKIQTTKASSRVFFTPGKSGLRAAQKLVLRDLADTLQGRTQISIQLAARRHTTAKAKLGKQRNTQVVKYLRSLGVEATFQRTNVARSGSPTGEKNNRVTIQASWSNPAS
jgi:uncharacterized repeat protein (TIGR02543 family)